MIRKIDNKKMGRGNHGWLDSIFHFSFAEYYNPSNINFGVLRVINDDLIEGGYGFDPHPHRDMEIISYVIDGELTHSDSMGNERTVTRGDVQYMSAGRGVTHSEYNNGKDILRLLQIWIFPDKKGYTPSYGDYHFNAEDRKNKWLHLVSSKQGNAPIKINQDANIYALELSKDEEITFPLGEGRQAYLVQIEGSSLINKENLNPKDALEAIEEDLTLKATEASHYLIIEMEKENLL